MRPAAADDRPFLRAVFASARSDAPILALWPAEQREPFLDQQFRFQSRHYDQVFAEADRLVVTREGVPAGRLILDRGPTDWRIVDIALLPAARGSGLGTALLTAIQAQAAAAGAKSVSLHVEHANPARRLYARLGFEAGEDEGIHIEMAWKAG